jgi:hypothetical protein
MATLDLEKEQLKVKLYESQMMLLQYMMREAQANIEAIERAKNELPPVS